MTFNNIIGFINKAIENNYEIIPYGNLISIYNEQNKEINIRCIDKNTIIIGGFGVNIEIPITDQEYHIFMLTVHDINEYLENKLTDTFNNFFKDEVEKVPDINDLDDND